ncbi:ComEA family DNA-binding protein [Phytohabitans rumicis]|nr:ComEA family DNA-binding protein [Phytohabitans rumicis]
MVVRQRLLRLHGRQTAARPAMPAAQPGTPPPVVPHPTRSGAPQGTVHRTALPRGETRAGPQHRRVRVAEPAARVDGGDAAQRPSRAGGASAFDPGRRGVKALAGLAAVVVLVAGFFAWRSRPHAEPVTAEPAQAASTVDGGTGDTMTAPPSGGEVVVAVAGKVRRPGLVRLPAGARVADALAAAGGALPGTDVSLLNLARKVVDGELILVGVTAAPDAGGGGQDGGVASGGKVNLNTATLAQLDALPGVGPVLAQRILDHRERHGGFRSVSDLRQVDGIGDARYEQLKELVTV